MVTPRVSGLERSQEKSLEPHFKEPVSSSTSPSPIGCFYSPPVVKSSVAVPRPSPVNGNGARHNGSPPLSKPKPFLSLPLRSQYNRSASGRYHHSYKALLASGLHYECFSCSSQQRCSSQTPIICFICCRFLHTPSNSLHQCVSALQSGLWLLGVPPTPVQSRLWGLVHVFAWSASTTTSASSSPLSSYR